MSLMSYDSSINFFLTMFFLWPLFNSSVLNPKVRRVATRTLMCVIKILEKHKIDIDAASAATVALTTSMVTMTFLFYFFNL
jgi:hypothetical protein